MNYYIYNGKLYSQNELRHSRGRLDSNVGYIDLPPDVLVHWKYIKREKLPNGKYRYYYDFGQKEKAAAQAAQKEAEAADKALKAARGEVEEGYARVEDKRKALSNVRDNWWDAELAGDKKGVENAKAWYAAFEKDLEEERAKFGEVADKKKAAEKAHEKAKEAADKALKAYEKTPLYKLEKTGEKIKSGMKKVANALKKLFGKR